MKNNQIIVIVLLIVVGGGAFFGGMQYQKSKQSSFFGQFGNNGFQGQGRGMMGGNRANGFRPVNGEIISSDDKSITVKLADGSTKIIILSDSTVINKEAKAAKSDLKTGEKVAVFGQTNSDGSVTAQSVQLNPNIRMGLNGSPRPTR